MVNPGPTLTIKDLKTRAVRVPMNRALATSSGKMSEAPLVLIDLETNEGVTGHAYLFCYHPMTASMMQRVLAERPPIRTQDPRRDKGAAQPRT